ncbi:hypothetical protein QFZ22_000895 [Streptomyces canus]|uniref:Major facilitator superfamily (MFS) profile domain-containing protein n=1 Tax=Streptomyces canus TaxID=58343 RepID=A0AAW8F707_9ACTN|nr:hypothetical protein [Streptomyces canus]MDQ0904910.1 hypothetical protein [Streptomyces canus]
MDGTTGPDRGRAAPGEAAAPAAAGVPGRLIVLPAVACGMTVANLSYAQPLLSSLSRVFGIGTATAGMLVTLTQAGYVIGMLFLVPLGDRLEKRRLVTALLSVTTIALAVAGLAPGFPVLLAAALVPYAASLALDETRGPGGPGDERTAHRHPPLPYGERPRLGHGRLAGRLPRLGRPHGRPRGQPARGPARAGTDGAVLGAAVPLLTLAYWSTERRARPGTPVPV